MNYVVRVFYAVALLLCSISCSAQTGHWRAKWIGIPYAEKDTNIWTAFRKEFVLKDVPGKVLTKIATDSKYWLWVNGKMVVFEGELKRGPSPRDTYYDELDLAKYLVKGSNTISILTWYWGRDGFDHKSSGKSALLFEAALGNREVISDKTWKAIRHPAFGNTGPPFPNYRLPEFNIYFDAQRDIPLWNQPGFDDAEWANVREYGIPPVSPWNALVKRPIPLWKDSGLLYYVNQSDIPGQSDGSAIIAKLPKNITITPYLKIDAPRGLKIDIRTDNYKGGSEYNVRTEYITKGGIQEFETFGYMNGHEVQYRIPAGVKIIALKYRETRYDTERVGAFSCDDPFYNILWEKSYNTLNVNLRDAIQDPDRERAQWWGDAVILMGQILYACDPNGLLAIQKAIHNLVDWQRPDGVLYSPVPTGKWTSELPAQMLASIGKYGFWKYYRYTGDTALIRYVYPAVKKYIGLWKLGRDGLVIHRPGDWDWLDWGEDIDAPLMENAWYYMALEAASHMAELTKNGEDTAGYQTRLRSIKENYNKAFWKDTAYASPENKGVIDDRGNGLAVVAGLADAGKFKAIQKVLHTEYHASPYMEKYILESFFIMHDAAGGLERMQKRYKNMVDSKLTTLWEGWGIGSEGYGGGSYNHGWSGGPLTLLSQYVAGIAPEKPGYKTFTIMPQPGNLLAVHCVTPTVRGTISMDLKREAGDREERLSVEVPPGTRATIGVPRMDAGLSLISVNGAPVFENGAPAGKHPGLEFAGENEHYFLFTVKPGKWDFVAQSASTYSDGRPSAKYRLDAKDAGIVLKYGTGPDSCDYLGARDVFVFEDHGTYYMHYDGAGPKGWLACLATSTDLVNWKVKGPVLDYGKPGSDDSRSASYGSVYWDGVKWHMFYLGTPHVSPAPNYVPAFPYLAEKAESNAPGGPWKKRYDISPLRTVPGTYYSGSVSPGKIIKEGNEYLMLFSASTDGPAIKRTLSYARTKNLDSTWVIDPAPFLPPTEQVENSAVYYEPTNKTWFVFTDHVGIRNGLEYTDAIWVYWTRDLHKWNPENKAVVLDSTNCRWSKYIIGLPSVVKRGNRLAIFYDGNSAAKMPGGINSHMRRDVGLAWLNLPLRPPVSDTLSDSFVSPPDSAKPRVYWFWVYNRVDKAAIKLDLEQFKAKGISGVNLICTGGYAGKAPLPGVQWLGSEWRELFRYAVSEANKLHIEIGFNMAGGWTMMGPWVTPDNAMKKVVSADVNVTGPGTFSGTLPQPKIVDGYYHDILVQAFRVQNDSTKQIKPGTLIDLTSRMKPDGHFEWVVPKGNWVILRTGYTLTGATWSKWHAYPDGDTFVGGDGYEIDYLNKHALDDHFNHLGKLVIGEAKKAGAHLDYLWSDSWECGKLTWTQDFPDQFSRFRGYDLKPYLPVLAGYTVTDTAVSERFRDDFDRTIQDCVAENYYGHFQELCHQYGLKVGNEAGGPNDIPPQDVLKNFGHCDILSGEFWVNGNRNAPGGYNKDRRERLNLKQTATAAHVYGKRQAEAEAFTEQERDGTHWSLGPSDLKPYANDAFCEGINRLMLHEATCQPPSDGKPGYEFCAGQHFNPNITWWEQSPAFFTYLSRCQYMLQQGTFVGDVCFYLGERPPLLAPPKYVIPSLGPGYDCDYSNPQVLLTRMAVRNGRIVLPDGMSYRLLVLQDCVSPSPEIAQEVGAYQNLSVSAIPSTAMSLAVIRKIKALIESGATVVGAPPVMSAELKDYPDGDAAVRQIAAGIWGDLDGKTRTERRVGKGRVIWGKTPREVLMEEGVVPDFTYPGQTERPEQFDYIHRTSGETEIYFVANRTNREEVSDFTFRVAGKQPWIWDPVTGKSRQAAAFNQAGGCTTLSLDLDAFGSYFVVFRDEIAPDARGEAAENFPKLTALTQLTGSWNTTFDTTWGGPANAVFPELISWTKRPEKGIKYYSGKATYKKTFDIPRVGGGRLYLDLGEVKNVAVVRLNGKSLGILWCAPWRVDITDAVKPTGNVLEVDVINLWANRVIGDLTLPRGKRVAHTHDAFRFDMLTAATPLLDAGLIGPVTLYSSD